MNCRYFFLFFMIMMLKTGYSQNEKSNSLFQHTHHHNEIGIGSAPYYFIKRNEIAYGLHIHYNRIIGETKFGTGIGYERIFDEHKHNTFTLIGSYSPLEDFTVSLSPGVVFEDSSVLDLNFALHFELTYEFEFKFFHFGPSAEFSYDSEDYHLSLGLHLGYGF